MWPRRDVQVVADGSETGQRDGCPHGDGGNAGDGRIRGVLGVGFDARVLLPVVRVRFVVPPRAPTVRGVREDARDPTRQPRPGREPLAAEEEAEDDEDVAWEE